MPIVDADGVAIAYSDTGPRDAPVVMFGHGMLFADWMFEPQIAALQEKYRCIALDFRGQGDSPATPGGYDMDTLTADVVAVIKALGLAPVHWVGLSMGGFIGLRLAARHGELVRSLTVLNATAAALTDPTEIAKFHRVGMAQRVMSAKRLARMGKSVMFGPTFLASAEAAAVIDEWVDRLKRRNRAAIHKTARGVASRESAQAEITGITAPTLVVIGADDQAVPLEEAMDIVDRIPGAQVLTIANCGHTSTLEQPVHVSNALLAFLGEVDDVPSPPQFLDDNVPPRRAGGGSTH